jgi:hypothetical protein
VNLKFPVLSVVVPVYVLLPDNIKGLAPFFVKFAPVPPPIPPSVKAPENEPDPTVKVWLEPPMATDALDGDAEPLRVLNVEPEVVWLMSKVPVDPLKVNPLESAMEPEPERASVPFPIAVAPV